MRSWVLAGLFISLILIAGCAEKECKVAEDCLEKTCFTAKCKENACEYSMIANCCGNDVCEAGEVYPDCAADCPNCDDRNECTADEFDYNKQKCMNTPNLNVVCCGNGLCELSEDYESCTRDCPDCDDKNDCTEDSFDYHKQECVNKAIANCCGNNLCEEGVEEFSSCPVDCPDCDDSDRMTGDSFNYESQECEYVTYLLYEDFSSGVFPWGVDPRWAVAGGLLSKVPDAEYAYRGFGTLTWTDYTFRIKVRLEQGFVEMNFRSAGEQGTYSLSLFEGTTLSLSREGGEEGKGEKGRTSLGIAEFSFDPATFYDVSAELKGGSIKVYVDDALLIEATDPSPIPSGNIGLYISDKAYIDEVIVEAP